jgi:hypothetical protein
VLGFQAVVDPKALGGVDVEGVELLGCDPANLGGLGAVGQFAADRPSPETQRELLAYLPVVVGDDVAWIAVDANDPENLDRDAGLLDHFAYHRVGDAFPKFYATAG